MGDEHLYYTFKHDTRGFIDQIKELLIQLESTGYSAEIINEMFRCVHSIKSEADYLGFTEIASAVNEMESAIEPLRNGEYGILPVNKLIDFCSAVAEKIDSLLSFTEPPVKETSEETGTRGGGKASCKYSEFELFLIKEARERGESLYEVTFSIAAQEIMKYPRVYLAMNNLELNHNVIKMEPRPDEINDDLPDRVRVILTSFDEKDSIGSDIEVDQIEAIAVSRLDFETELMNISREEGKKEPPAAKNRERGIHVDVSDIAEISEYVSQIKGRLSGLSSAFSGKDGWGKLESDLQGLEKISDGIENLMVNLKTVDFNSYFAGYKKTVKDIAARLGKQAELYFDKNSARIEKEFADYAAELLLQLLRNAVAHGIETPEVREAAGKQKTGRIDISIISDGRDILISVGDDGAGITDENGSGQEDLLERITAPGFTTLSPAVKYAGRGVGLDLVKNRLQQRNGRLELKNRPGAGCEFTMIFAGDNDEEVSFTIVRDGNKTFALRDVETDDVVSIQTASIEEKNGRFFRKNDELFSCRGKLKKLPEDSENTIQGVRIFHEGASGFFVFDEALFEVKLKKSSCSTGSETGKYLNELEIDGKKADYDILNLGVLFD